MMPAKKNENVKAMKWLPEEACCLGRMLAHAVGLLVIGLFLRTLFLGLGMTAAGTLPLTLFVLSPFIFAAAMSLAWCIHPSCSKIATCALVFFLVYMFFFRGVFVRCAENWKDECATDPIKVDGVAVGCKPGLEGDNTSNKMDLFEYCKSRANISDSSAAVKAASIEPPMPHFSFIGKKVQGYPKFCTPFAGVGWYYNLCRVRCHPYTCYFRKGGSPDFKITAWRLWFWQVFFVLVTAMWWSNCLPLCHCCMKCGLVSGDFQRQVNHFFACGRLPHYFMWLWAAWIPLWLSAYVTFVDGHFEEVMPKIKFDWSMATALFTDTKNILISASVLAVFVLAYIQRDAICQALGLDDRYIFHWANLFGADTDDKDCVLQICVWKVQGDYPSDQHPKVTESKKPWWSSCGRRGGTRVDARPALELKHESTLFIRVAYGDNEPLNGRVVRVPPTYGDSNFGVTFKEVFRVNLDQSPLAEQPPLYIELQNQNVVSRTDLGRVVITPERLQHIIKEQKEGMAQKQVTAMFADERRVSTGSASSETSPFLYSGKEDKEDKLKGKELNFQFEPLARGGGIWYAIAVAEDEDDA